MGSNIFVESDRVANSGRKNKKRLIIVTGLLLGIVIIAVVLWNTEQGRELLHKLGLPVSLKDSNKDKKAESQPTNMLNYDASKLATSGDTKATIEMYQNEIDRSSNKEDKAIKLLELSTLLWNNGQGSDSAKLQALEYAKQAEQMNPTPQSAASLYIIYKGIGNDSEADRYIKLRDERGSDAADDSGGS